MLLQKTDAAAVVASSLYAAVSCRYFRGPQHFGFTTVDLMCALLSLVPTVKNVQLLNLLCYCFYPKIAVQSFLNLASEASFIFQKTFFRLLKLSKTLQLLKFIKQFML